MQKMIPVMLRNEWLGPTMFLTHGSNPKPDFVMEDRRHTEHRKRLPMSVALCRREAR